MHHQAVDVPKALEAVQEILIRVGRLDNDVIFYCIDVLEETWHITDKRIVTQIIETAAINVGLAPG